MDCNSCIFCILIFDDYVRKDLCYVMLCYVMLCYVMLLCCYVVMLCYVSTYLCRTYVVNATLM